MITGKEAWHRLWAYRRLYWLDRGSEVTAQLESPLAGQPFLQHLLVRGVVRTREPLPVTLTCVVGGVRVHESVVSPDATATGPQSRPFEAVLPARDIPAGRVLWFRLFGQINQHGRPRLLDSMPLRRVARAPAQHPRHEYGRVWDADVRDMSSARVAVAGYADDAEWDRSGRATAANVREALRLSSTDTVLEIGCGSGRVGAHLAPLVATWIGGDASANMLTHARVALAGQPNVRFVHLNGFDLHGVDTASVDAVYCTAVFMHLDEWDRYRYIVEAHRVLRRGGRMYIDNFDLRSRDGWVLFLEMAKLDPAVRPPNVSKASTEQELTWYAQQAGFTVTSVDAGALFVTVVARKNS
jgi:ubiquinone/menaquinone biosynthesis C-methylase UbiE